MKINNVFVIGLLLMSTVLAACTCGKSNHVQEPPMPNIPDEAVDKSPMHPSAANVHTNMTIENKNETIRHRFTRMFRGNITALKEHIIQKLKQRVHRHEYMHRPKNYWKTAPVFKEFKHRVELSRMLHKRYVKKYRHWQRVREECIKGNCAHYFNATKDFLLNAINISINKIQDINGTKELVNELQYLKEEIISATNITELRGIYPEIKETVRLANQVFAKQALLSLIDTYIEKLNEYPENETAELREQLMSLKNNIYTMNIVEVVHTLKTIRVEILLLNKGSE